MAHRVGRGIALLFHDRGISALTDTEQSAPNFEPQQGQRYTRVLSPRARESHQISYPMCAEDSFLEMNFPAREIQKMCGAVISSTPYVAITFTQLAALINFCIISRWKDCQTFLLW